MDAIKKTDYTSMEEFEKMDKDNRYSYELIDGLVMMSPRPSITHQLLSKRLAFAIDQYLVDCESLQDAELQLDNNILVPDIMVVCDDHDLEAQRITIPPLLVVEILSPSTMSHDYIYKLNAYKRLDIAEYWIVDPKGKSIIVHCFAADKTTTYYHEDMLTSCVYKELQISLKDIFR